MKKFSLLIMIITFLIVFTGCKKGDSLINIENANKISIFYGASSYAMFSDDEDIIKTVTGCLNGLRFEETDIEMDIFSMITICISSNDGKSTLICVDSKGIFWINGNTVGYKIAFGTFDYDYIKDIYEKSK